MPKALEEKLKKEYGAKSDIPYRIMNSAGLMKGSRVTPKGEAMEKKHENLLKSGRAGKIKK